MMISAAQDATPGRKAHHTAKWARTMTKWLITYNQKTGAKWQLVEFGGPGGAESRGIVDLMAIRKDHRCDKPGLKRGDLFEIVLIQTKGGSAARPTAADVERLKKVASYYKAKAVVLAEWERGRKLQLYQLMQKDWKTAQPKEIFG